MMQDRACHGGMLPIENSNLLGGLLPNPGQRSIVRMAHERAQMMDDVVVKPAGEPTYERITRRIIGCCREGVIHAVVKLTAARGKVGAVDGVCRLKYQRYSQTDNQVDQHERGRDQQS